MAHNNNFVVEANGAMVDITTYNGWELDPINLTPDGAREAARKLNEAADKAQENDENERRRKFREDRWGV